MKHKCKTCDYWEGYEGGDLVHPTKPCNRYPPKSSERAHTPTAEYGCGEHSAIREGQPALVTSREASMIIPSDIGVEIIEYLKNCPEPLDSENCQCILCKSSAVGGNGEDGKLIMHEDTCPWKMARKAQ